MTTNNNNNTKKTKMEFMKKFRASHGTDDAEKLFLSHPNCVPIIVDRHETSDPKLSKNKFLVPGDLTVGQFQGLVRRSIGELTPEEALFFFINEQLVVSSRLLSQVYADHYKAGEKRDFLYVTYTKESVFGV